MYNELVVRIPTLAQISALLPTTGSDIPPATAPGDTVPFVCHLIRNFRVSVFATSSNCLRNLFIAHTVVVGARLTKAEAEALRRWVVLAGRALPVPPNGTLEIPGGTTHLNLGPPALPIQFLGCSS